MPINIVTLYRVVSVSSSLIGDEAEQLFGIWTRCLEAIDLLDTKHDIQDTLCRWVSE